MALTLKVINAANFTNAGLGTVKLTPWSSLATKGALIKSISILNKLGGNSTIDITVKQGAGTSAYLVKSKVFASNELLLIPIDITLDLNKATPDSISATTIAGASSNFDYILDGLERDV